MLPFVIALLAAVQPIPVADQRATMMADAKRVDATTTVPKIDAARTGYTAIAAQAQQLGDAPLAAALRAKSAYALIIAGRDREARFALISVLKDPAATDATRAFARGLLDFINAQGKGLGYSSPDHDIGLANAAVTLNGVRNSTNR